MSNIKHEIICGDVIDWAREYDGPKFHCILTDPSYALSKKKPLDMDAKIEDKIETVADLLEAYHSLQRWGDTGFMGKAWDDSLAFNPQTWRLLAEHLHPGGFIFAFASSRGWHRLAVAMEDAGLIFQPSVFVWGEGWVEVPMLFLHLQGQSFPKATRIDTQIDRRSGKGEKELREFCAYIKKMCDTKDITNKQIDEYLGLNSGGATAAHYTCIDGKQPRYPRLAYYYKLKELLGLDNRYDNVIEGAEREIVKRRKDGAWSSDAMLSLNASPTEYNETAPATDLARAWEGHRYGGQILKDAATPIICAQKPWTNPRLDCIVETGAGALWVDGGRIGTNENTGRPVGASAYQRHSHTIITGGKVGNHKLASENTFKHPQGRWPPNFALCHKKPETCPDCENGVIWKPDGTWISLCPKCETADGPGVWMGGELDKCPDCGSEIEEQREQRFPSPCPTCGGNGVVGGCGRVGVKRVKGTNKPTRRGHLKDVWGFKAQDEIQDYADPDGLETVDAWECAEGCVCAKLGEMSGELGNALRSKRHVGKQTENSLFGKRQLASTYPDSGTAARFFPQCGWEHERAEMRCSPDCPVAKLDEQAGPRLGPWGGPKTAKSQGGYGGFATGPCDCPKFADGEKASRYFQQSDWSHEIAERLATEDPVRYVPKAAKRERNQNLDDFYWRKDKKAPIGFVRITKDEWEALGAEEKRIKAETGKRASLRAQGNIHPTLKPLSLIKWLATLLSPPKEYAPRRILVPFCGTFSEGIGAILSGGFEEVVGVEIHQDYCDIGEARARWWTEWLEKTGESEPKDILKAANKKPKKPKKKKKTGRAKLL